MSAAKKLTKADIFKLKPITHIETLELEEMPGITFGIKVMTAGARDEYENSLYDLIEKKDGGLKPVPHRKDTRLKLIVNSLCDPESGDLIFTLADVSELRDFPGTVIQKLADKCSDVNGLGKKEDAADLEKNSETDQESTGD